MLKRSFLVPGVMRVISAALVPALLLAGPAMTQSLTSNSGGAYESHVRATLECLADAPGDNPAQQICVATVIDDCRNRAGVYQACLSAVSDALRDAQARLIAAGCDPLDPACALLRQGRALSAAGTDLDARAWRRAMTGVE